MFNSNNFLSEEKISLDNEITKLGVQQTPFTSLLLSRGKIGTINAPVHTWREVTINNDEDISVIEGNKNVQFQQSVRATLNNVAEVFQRGASVTGTVEAMSGNGITNQFAKEINDRLLELKINMEKKLTKGVKNDGSTTPFIRRMQGIENWIHNDNIVETAVKSKVAEADIINTVRKLWGNSGSGLYIALVNSTIKEQIDLLYKDAYFYPAKENEFGLVVNRIQTTYGIVDLLLTPHASVDKLTIFDVNDLEIDFLRKPQFEKLGKTGDATEGFVVAEATLYVSSPKKVAQLKVKTV